MAFLTRQLVAVKNLWCYRDLVTSLAARNLKVKYKRSALGFVWTLINPLLMVTILVGVFTYVVRIRLDQYWAFLISGYFVWNFLAQMIHSGTYVLKQHGELSRAVAYPKEAPIVAAALSRLVEFVFELALILLALAVFHHGRLPLSFLVLPWLVVLQVALALSLVFPIATLSAFYHDLEHAVPLLMTMLFYLSPVFYSADQVPEKMQPLYLANPLARLLTLYQSTLYFGQTPTAPALLTATVFAGVLLVIGYGIFNRYERLFAEIV